MRPGNISRWQACAVVAGAAAAVVALALPAAASASEPAPQVLSAAAHVTAPVPGTDTVDYYTVQNYYGPCLDIPDGTKTKGTQPQLYGCNGKGQQTWVFYLLDGGKSFVMQNWASGLCLSIDNNDPNPGGKVIQYTCNYSGSDTYEDWYLSQSYGPSTTGTEYYLIMNRGGANCGCGMHPSGNQTTWGTTIWNARPDTRAFLWQFRPPFWKP